MSYIFINGKFVGETNEPEKLVKEIRERRRKGEISYQVNVAYYKHLDEVRILTDPGRIRRPLIVVENGKPKLTPEIIEKIKRGEMGWEDLIKNGIIEYLDAEEEENAYIALKPENLTEEHTHLELDPSLIVGLSASLIPFAEFNRGDRVNYGAKMTGQSIGMFSINFLSRVDTKSNILIYPQRPLIQTYTHQIINYEQHAAGQNVIVILSCYDGYNIEDAIVMNKSAIERLSLIHI